MDLCTACTRSPEARGLRIATVRLLYLAAATRPAWAVQPVQKEVAADRGATATRDIFADQPTLLQTPPRDGETANNCIGATAAANRTLPKQFIKLDRAPALSIGPNYLRFGAR
jgi:hypothetical protein